MRICLVSQEYPPYTGWGGIGTQTRHKALGLSARGHEIHVLTTRWDGPSVVERAGEVTLHRQAAPDMGLLPYDGPAYWLARSLAVAQKLKELCGARPFDLIQFPEYCGEGFVFQTDDYESRTSRYAVQMHGPMAMFAEDWGWPPVGSAAHQIGSLMERMAVTHADLLLASSHYTAAFCARTFGCSLDRVQVIHSGIDTDQFTPREQPAGDADPRILFVGKLSAGKGFLTLVQAVLGLRGRFPRVCLRAVGRANEESLIRQVHELIQKAGAEANFDFHANTPYDQLPAHYAWCDYLAGPSLVEPGPGNIYLESMSCGKPVIACDSGGTRESVLHRETGLLVRPKDVDALQEALAQLAEDADLRKRYGRQGREWVLSRFAMNKYIDRVESNYRAVVAGEA